MKCKPRICLNFFKHILKTRNKMKKLILASFMLITLLPACENMDFSYDDYETQSVYFPYQYPVRVLSMGDDYVDNSLDQAGIFNIGVNVGGIWQSNKEDRQVEFCVDNSLVPTNTLLRDGEYLEPLPTSYYSMEPAGSVTIPEGSIVGKIQINLNDAFYEDPKSLTGQYVIPLYIESASVDIVVRGTVADNVNDPNRHIVADWESNKTPMDYTLFGIKYVNPYHGAFLRRGEVVTKDASGTVLDTNVIHQSSVDKDEVVYFFSSAKNEVVSSYVGDNASYEMVIKVGTDNKITISSADSSQDLNITGQGEWVVDGDSWGIDLDGNPTPRDVMHLDYSYELDGNNVFVKDTVVLRDRQITFIDERPDYVE